MNTVTHWTILTCSHTVSRTNSPLRILPVINCQSDITCIRESSTAFAHILEGQASRALEHFQRFRVLRCCQTQQTEAGERVKKTLTHSSKMLMTRERISQHRHEVSEYCHTAPSSTLLILSSPQVWRQSVVVNHHHLCPGMLLDLVDHVVDPGDDPVRTLP
jgi:hypothetical protein